MKVPAVILVILGSLYLGAECATYKRQETCFEDLNKCSRSVPGNAFIAGISSDYRLLITEIDELCENTEQAVQCAQSALPDCRDEVRHQVEAAINIREFLCSSRGKSLLREYQQSSCYDEPEKIYELEAVVQMCTIEVAFNPNVQDDRCQVVRDIIQCFAGRVSEACGEAAGQIIEGIGRRVVSVATEGQCTNEIANDYLKRGVDILKRRLYRK